MVAPLTCVDIVDEFRINQLLFLSAPSSAQISKAIALNDAFFDGLERIADGSSANNH